jgi:Lon protease-like protein
VFFKPTTLVDGTSVCSPCAAKLRVKSKTASKELGFGTKINPLLDQIAQTCAATAYQSAALRFEANEMFKSKNYAEAIGGYTQSIEMYPTDPVVWSNRAAARLQLSEDAASVIEDAAYAARLIFMQDGLPHKGHPGKQRGGLLIKCLHRRASTLARLGQEDDGAVDAVALHSATVALAQSLGEKTSIKALAETVLALLGQGSTPGNEEDKDAESAGMFLAVTDAAASTTRAVLQRLQTTDCATDCFQAFTHTQPADESAPFRIDSSRLDEIRTNLECPLCINLLLEPATMPCGHTVCRTCLARTLDHAFHAPPSCPMCRADLAPYLVHLNQQARRHQARTGSRYSHGSSQIAVNKELDTILRRRFEAEYASREALALTEESAAVGGQVPTAGGASEDSASEAAAAVASSEAVNVPVFICSLAMPGVQCGLHVFEPRYRLMMRRCIESGQGQFGMVVSKTSPLARAEGVEKSEGDEVDRSAVYGCMLHIENFRQLPDGRSSVETVGGRRFKVVEWGEKDAYAVANVVWLDDDHLSAEERREAAILCEEVREICEERFHTRGPPYRSAVEQQLGGMPDEDVPLVYWCIAANMPNLQMKPETQYEFCFGSEISRRSHMRRTKDLLVLLKCAQ